MGPGSVPTPSVETTSFYIRVNKVEISVSFSDFVNFSASNMHRKGLMGILSRFYIWAAHPIQHTREYHPPAHPIQHTSEYHPPTHPIHRTYTQVPPSSTPHPTYTRVPPSSTPIQYTGEYHPPALLTKRAICQQIMNNRFLTRHVIAETIQSHLLTCKLAWSHW